jgi:hypothetical protein
MEKGRNPRGSKGASILSVFHPHSAVFACKFALKQTKLLKLLVFLFVNTNGEKLLPYEQPTSSF